MNFLKLCQRTQLESGIQGLLTSVSGVNQSSQEFLIIEAVKNAWIDIQTSRHDFKFRRKEQALTIGTATTIYKLDDIFTDSEIFSEWITSGFIYDFTPLRYIPYDEWVLIENTTASKPAEFTIKPEDNTIVFNPVDQNYDITLHYYRSAQELENNLDIPIVSSQFHNLIVYASVLDVSSSSGDLITYQRNALKFSQLLGTFYRAYVPHKSIKRSPIA